MKITICGDLNNSKEITHAKKILEKKGFTIFTPQDPEKVIDQKLPLSRTRKSEENIKHELIKKHHASVKNSDAILIINPNKIIEEDIFTEIQLAHILEKKIYILNPVPKTEYAQELEEINPIILKGNLSKIQ